NLVGGIRGNRCLNSTFVAKTVRGHRSRIPKWRVTRGWGGESPSLNQSQGTHHLCHRYMDALEPPKDGSPSGPLSRLSPLPLAAELGLVPLVLGGVLGHRRLVEPLLDVAAEAV